MKIVTASEMFRVEKLAYERGASEESYMRRAGYGIAEHVRNRVKRGNVLLLCGKGNNGGDAYVAGYELLKLGYTVRAIALAHPSECSPLNQLQRKKFEEAGGKVEEELKIEQEVLLLDGILGTGFKGEVTGKIYDAIAFANDSHIPILSIDIPSGINGTTGEIGGVAIKATETLFLGLPKWGCFLGEAWNHVGKVSVFDFGLEKFAIEEAVATYHLITEELISFPEILRTRHKYQAGYVVGIGGSRGMPGAICLAGLAALRAGAGIVRILHPQEMEDELSGAPYELIREGYRDSSTIIAAMEKAGSLFIGPGMGVKPKAGRVLKKVLKAVHKPCIIDAEALTLIAKKGLEIPKNAILTPHHGEMKRLLDLSEMPSMADFLTLSQKYVDKHEIILVLKGAPTFILQPKNVGYICPRGDPGMATAGSGDVLTGMIAAWLTGEKTPLEAAITAVYLHALAGEEASKKYTSFGMIAGDIIAELASIYKNFR